MPAILPSICNIKPFSDNPAVSSAREGAAFSPETDSENHIPEAHFLTLKKLKEYSITALKIVVTIIILPTSCALSIPVAFIRLIVETIKNRYMHYKKYHPGTHCLNPIATYRNKKKICAELKAYCNHIASKLNEIIKPKSTRQVMKPLVDSIKPDTCERPHSIIINLNKRIERLHHAFFDLYKEKDLREMSPEENKKTEELLDQVSETYKQLKQAILAIPEDQFQSKTSKENNFSTELFALCNWLSEYKRLYQRNIICPYCCPLCVSTVGELMPYTWRALLFTLNISIYFPFLSFVGVYRTVELVLSEIWGTRKPVNYFPWNPGEAHRFPFSTRERKGIETLMP